MAEAAAVLAEHGAPPDAANLDLYKHIVSSVLGLSKDEQSKAGELSCKDFLWQLLQPIQATLAGSHAIGKVGSPLQFALSQHAQRVQSGERNGKNSLRQ